MDTTATFVRTEDLPSPIRDLLRDVGCSVPSVGVETTDRIAPSSTIRSAGFSAIVDLSGGAAVMLEFGVPGYDDVLSLLPGYAVVKGFLGDRGFATVFVNPNGADVVLRPYNGLTGREMGILAQFRSLSDAGRWDEWIRFPASRPTASEISSLVSRKLLSWTKSGDLSLTPSGMCMSAGAKLPS